MSASEREEEATDAGVQKGAVVETGVAVAVAVNVVMLTIAAAASVPWLRDAIEVSRTKVTDMAPNSDEEAEAVVLSLIGEAESEIIMYDDGDTSGGSLYQSPHVVQAIRDKIRERPDFTVRCVLNDLGSTHFEVELSENPNVDIRRRRDNPSRVHYKIIDGRKAYISCHQPGQAARNRRMIDCTRSQSRHAGRRPLALQRYFDDFERYAA